MAKFANGGHIERNEFRVPKSVKPPPPVDNTLKEITKKYLEQKEQEMLQYESEMEQKRRDEEIAKKMQETEEQLAEERRLAALQMENEKNDRDSKIEWDFSKKVYHIMRDTNNPILIDKASEIYNDKGSLVQFRYSQGDPGALEEEKLPYRLSKTNQFDMTDKLSGEQNRMVYAQVRPSYFENKSQTPLFDCPTKRIMNSAGNDITMQKTADLVRLDSQKSNGNNTNSSSNICSPR